MTKPTVEELRDRISQAMRVVRPEEILYHALIWEGYLAALLEWQLLGIGDYRELHALLPTTPERPALGIFCGADYITR